MFEGRSPEFCDSPSARATQRTRRAA